MIGTQTVQNTPPAGSLRPAEKSAPPEKPVLKLQPQGGKAESEKQTIEMDRQALEEILEVMGKTLFGTDTHYEFRLHEKTGTVVCKLVNNETEEVVREIPSEKILDMVAGIWELVGILVDRKA